jgi:hypothetical protein
MRDRFLSEEVWETLGLPVEECVGHVESSQIMREFRSRLFSRIVPAIKEIGLWGPKIRRAYSNMGITGLRRGQRRRPRAAGRAGRGRFPRAARPRARALKKELASNAAHLA